MNREPLDAVQAEAAALGLSLALVRRNRHFVLRVSDNAGHSGLLVVARSGSDRRGRYQARAQVRRLAKQLGGDLIVICAGRCRIGGG